MPVFGLNNGMVPIIGYNYGANKPERIHKTIKLSMLYATLLMVIGFAVFPLLPEQLLLLFAASEDMLKIGGPALRIISFSFLLAGLNIIASSSCQAFGYGMYSLYISAARQTGISAMSFIISTLLFEYTFTCIFILTSKLIFLPFSILQSIDCIWQ